ncbi:MAG: DegT/DnrJ/EryC1/StrS family aminotransferase [Magnetococcales bacterium]|nr:DegT/DnrJ/EryC1/StrS family aminotransferase [Magnetococcales bacterium]
MNHFLAEPKALRFAMRKAAARVIDSCRYVLDRECEKFEQRWCQTCGSRFGIGTGNGLDALEIALRALRIGPGDEVITTSMTAFATVLAILRAGAIPVLADIEPGTAVLAPESVQRCLTSRTRAVLLVHLYGRLARMDFWRDWCSSHNIALIEDCAQAHLACWQGSRAGSFGVISAFSFYPTKNLGALGDAGMIVTSDPELARRAAMLRNYGSEQRGQHPEAGVNSRLDEIQAAILLERLPWLEDFTRRRRAVASAYGQGIRNPQVQLPPQPEEESAHVHHLYVICCDSRLALAEHLRRHGIESAMHYPLPIHFQRPCADLPRDPQGLVYAEQHASSCLSLPCHPQMNQMEIARVIDTVNDFAR